MSEPRHTAGVIEADQFCQCGYNLHGQGVTRDERLGFMVVRCPECGDWHPAGHGSTATRPWLRRLAAAALGIYGLILFACLSIIGLIAFGFTIGYFEENTVYVDSEPTSGRPVIDLVNVEGSGVENSTYVYLDTMQPVEPDLVAGVDNFNSRTQVPFATLPDGYWTRQEEPGWQLAAAFAGGFGLGGIVFGIFQSALLWHLRWPVKLLPMLYPVISSALVFYLVTLANPGYFANAPNTILLGLLSVQGSLAIGWLIGLLVGKPVARGLVRLVVPPKPRQVMAHLWHGDGKTLPMERTA